MREKFKKGEWVTRLVGDKFAVMTYDTGYGICETTMSDDTDKANAHLIAAAPKMYAMLDELKSSMYESGMKVAARKIEKLLAEARGEL